MRPSSAWALVRDGELLVVHAGADVRFGIPGLDEAVVDEVLVAWAAAVGDPTVLGAGRLSPPARAVFDQLITAGALGRDVDSDRDPATVTIHLAGAPGDGLVQALSDALDRNAVVVADQSDGTDESDDADESDKTGLAVLVRTSATLEAATEAARRLTGRYLFADLAYQHTVSVGPLVVAGQTACLGCLAGRLASRWGDPAPPPRPACAATPLAISIVAHEVAKAARGDSSLVNRTVTIDLDDWKATEGTVLRWPWCTCTAPAPGAGDRASRRLPLPWARST